MSYDFTPVVLCETRDDAEDEFGSKGLLLIRTTHLPAWAQSTYYARDEVHAGTDDEQVVSELKELLVSGNAMVLRKNARFLHAVSSVAAAMIDAASDPAVVPPPEMSRALRLLATRV